MTYPNYQQYAPAQPAYGQPPVQQQYAPQQPPMGGQGIAPPAPALGDGGKQGGVRAPKPRHLVGRTVIIEPLRVDETAMDTSVNPPVNRPEAYFNLTVVDGGPLRYGDNQDRDPAKQRPNTHEVDTPCRFTGVNDRGSQIVAAVREALSNNEAGRLGVIQQGTMGNRPFMLTKCSTDVEGNARPDGQQRHDAAMALWGKIWADKHAAPGAPRQFVSPEPRSLVAPAAPQGYGAPPQVNYGPPQQPPTQPQYAAPVPPAYAPQPAQSPYMPQGYATPNDGAGVPQGYYMPGQQPAASPVSAPVPAPAASAGPALPPGVEAWLATLPPELAAQQRAQFIAQQGGPAPAPAGPGM